MKIKFALKIMIILCGLLSSFDVAAEEEGTKPRLEEEERQLKIEYTQQLAETEEAPKKEEDFIFSYGGWISFTNTHYKNLDNDKGVEDWVKEDFYLDTRVWVHAVYYRMLTLYGRLQDYYVWRPKVASDYNGIGDDNRGPLIDMLYANLDLHRRFEVPLSVRLGRQFFTIGRGIAYSNIHDGAQVVYYLGRRVRLKCFLSRTREYEDNIDYSVPGYDKKGNERNFYGFEVGWTSPSLAIYSYALIQRDLSHEYPIDRTQNYTYNSEHIGIGVAGEPSPRLSYWGEVVKEYGDSNTYAKRTELAVKEVDAWAVDLGAKYNLDYYSHPILEGEFAYGSGDKERSRVTNTVGGNIIGKDTNFQYFGTFNAGYALYPRLSNMYIYKIGVTLKPFEMIPYIGNNIASGVKLYVYRKDEKSGGIYDIEATAAKEDVGQELDLFAYWKVYENLYITLRYGLFFPGAAYPKGKRENSEYLYLRTRFIF